MAALKRFFEKELFAVDGLHVSIALVFVVVIVYYFFLRKR